MSTDHRSNHPALVAHTSPDVNAAPKGTAPQAIDSSTLFGAEREVLIIHRGEHYRLRLTRQDKLLLTK